MAEELSTKRVKVFFNGGEFLIDPNATEDQVRDALVDKFPEAATANITQDENQNWVVTREAGQKGE